MNGSDEKASSGRANRHERRRPRVMFLGLRAIDGVQGGIETHVAELVRHLPYAVDEIEVIGRSPYRRKDAPPNSTLPEVRWLPTVRSQSLEAIVHSFIGVIYAGIRRPEVLHIHGIGPGIVTPVARALGIRVVATHHGDDYRREKWGALARAVLRLGERLSMNAANACISISPVGAHELGARYGRNVKYIPNGVRQLPIVPPGQLLQEYGLEEGRYIVNVARMVPEKRQIDLVEAFERADVPGLKLVLVGAADHSGDYVRSIEKRVNANDDIVMTGAMTGSRLAEIFGNSGLFALPSTHEGLPIVLLEAMSYSLPIIVSDLPVYTAMGLPRAMIFPVGNVELLSKMIRDRFSVPFGKTDWSEFLSRYDWGRIATDTSDIYKSVSRINKV